MINVRIRGIDTTIRNLVKSNNYIMDDARDGIRKAAEHLMDKTVSKFGVYQQTGGDPNGYGAWRKLKFGTRLKKVRKYGFSDRPLIATGNTKDSFSVKMGGKGRLSASVSSSSDALVHHIYGAPDANVPMRDPLRVTAKEEKQECHDIIERYIEDAIRRSGL